MSFLWPYNLLLLLLIVLLVLLYIWDLRRRRPTALAFSSLSLLRDVLPRHAGWRRHAPFALFALALTGLIVAVARPVAVVEVPLSRTTILLALDVSLSMCATDVEPNRLSVAQDAALSFIADQEPGTQIGLVAFAGFAEMVVPPTGDKELLSDAVRNLTTSLGTAIGSATLKSIDAIAEVNSSVAPTGVRLDEQALPQPDEFLPEIIVLLTDGANSQGILPLVAAQEAADRGLRVYTIGFGTNNPTALECSESQQGADAFGRGFGRGFSFGGGSSDFRRYLVIDEPTLEAVAELTGGQYFRAENASELLTVFLDLPRQVVLQKETREIAAPFVLLAALLGVAAVALGQLWHPST